jgi:ABC-type transport system involved in cytochrome c biogenesis permease subunit
MFSYALLGCAFVITIIGLIKKNYNPLSTLDSLILIGISFFTIGMLFGALWAKEAWGDYWTWDPKETWSAVTWLGFLTYLHLRRGIKIRKKLLYLVVILSFLALQMCWYGINYLPNAKESVHTYSRE